MKPAKLISRQDGLTVWEVVILVFVVSLLLALLLPALVPRRPRSGSRITCTRNLKQIGLALRIWSNDHAEKFPMAVSKNEGGSLEWIGRGEPIRHFLVISNELNSPKVLACPADLKRKPALKFASLTNVNLSYFLGLDASELEPQSILSGDRNISTDDRMMSGILLLASNSPVGWTKHIHEGAGNIGQGDGSAQQASTTNLQTQLGRSPCFPVRLEIP